VTARRWLLAAGATVAVAYALGGEWQSIRHGVTENHFLDAVTGLTYLGTGLIALDRRPGNRIGILMVLYGITWFFGNWGAGGIPIFFSLGFAVSGFAPLLGHLVLAYPSGRLQTTFERGVVVSAYLVTLALDATVFLIWDPRSFGCTGCPWTPALWPDQRAVDALQRTGDVFGVVIVGLFLVAVVLRWHRATPAERHDLSILWFASVLLAVTYGVSEFADPNTTRGFSYLLWELRALFEIALPVVFLVGLLRTRLARGASSDLLVALQRPLPPGGLRDALALTLSDPSLEIAYAVAGTHRWVDPDGRPIELPGFEDGHRGRATSLVERNDLPLATLIHDPALDPDLVRAATVAAGMAIENERLHAEVRSQLDEVRASRARIIEAGDRERRRVERDLHDGAQQRLLTASLALHAAARKLDRPEQTRAADDVRRASEELTAALAELRELARGIHPAILTDEGLGAALRSLADRCPIPVSFDAAPSDRLPSSLESTAYFVVSESLANVAKHSSASSAHVSVARRNGHLVIEVRDDGVGGVDPAKGSGLRGLRDRVATVNGQLHVSDGTGEGTTVVAELPLPDEAEVGA